MTYDTTFCQDINLNPRRVTPCEHRNLETVYPFNPPSNVFLLGNCFFLMYYINAVKPRLDSGISIRIMTFPLPEWYLVRVVCVMERSPQYFSSILDYKCFCHAPPPQAFLKHVCIHNKATHTHND